MIPAEILSMLAETSPEAIVLDGFNSAIIGIGHHWALVSNGATRTDVLIYDYQKMVAILVERDGMDEDEADEFLDFNCLGGYLGEHTPIFANLSGEMLPSPAVQAYDFGHENWII